MSILAETLTDTGYDISSELLLDTFVAPRGGNYTFQIRLSSIPTNDQDISIRLELTDAADAVLAPAQFTCSYAKLAAANTTFGVPMFGSTFMVTGEKMNIYAESTDGTATAVDYRIDCLYADELTGGGIQ